MSIIQMSEVQGEISRQKTKEEYSRNVKKLKVKLQIVQDEVFTLQKKIDTLTNTSNDKLIALKIAKFCKQRRFTPEMLFRFADRKNNKSVSKLEFHQTLNSIGLKLTKEEMMRVEYLIDQDLSGAISWSEYNGYLDTFGIKKQFTPGEISAKQALQKLDIDKMLKMTDENEDNQSQKQKKKHQNLLTYEDFLKYCHKHFKDMKDRQIATIFQRLQRNQLINLQTFLDYLQDQKDQQKKLQEKNKKGKMKRGESLLQDSAARKKAESLKGLIQSIFRIRRKNNQLTFHSAEFQRLEKLLNRNRGQLTNIFKEIDSKRKNTSFGSMAGRGSFGFNELISYFIEREQKSSDLVYAFQLIGHKLNILKQNPEAILGQYTKEPQIITQDQLRKFLESELQLSGKQLQIIKKVVPWQVRGNVPVSKIIDLMRVEQQKNLLYITPDLPSNRLIYRSGIMALRACLEIQKKMIKAKQTQWNDRDFGPNEGDQFGLESIQIPLPSQSLVWERTSQLGMMQFFQPKISNVEATTSASCPHQIIGQSISSLSLADSQWLHPRVKPSPETRQVGQTQLNYLFKGIYPYAFHPFAKYGIYVIKLWVDEKWKYVIIDDKIPCGIDNKPYFSAAKNLRQSFVSLVEKGLAKIYGNYKSVFSINSMQRYIVQLTGGLCLPSSLNVSMHQQMKDSVWSQIIGALKNQEKKSKQGEKAQLKDLFFALFKGKKQGINENFLLNYPIKLNSALQIPNSQKKNKHKSHRLLLLNGTKEINNQNQWNKHWSKQLTENKYAKNRTIIEATFKRFAQNQNSILINYKLFRKAFNLLRLFRIDWQKHIILRKDLQFQQKFKCRYQITSKSNQLQLVIYLKQTSLQSEGKINLDIKSIQDGKEALISQSTFKDVLSLNHQKFQKGKTIIIQLYVDNWKNDIQYLYNLTFYFSNPRFELKQRDRHLLFRYVSPFEQDAKIQWKELSKEQQQYVYRNFYKAAQRRGCCSCL